MAGTAQIGNSTAHCLVYIEMNRLTYRKEIETLFSAGHSANQVISILHQKHGPETPSRATVYRWALEVKRGDKELVDRPRSGRPKSVVAVPNIGLVERLDGENCKVLANAVANKIGISKCSVITILSGHLNMDKMNCRWAPRVERNAENGASSELSGDYEGMERPLA